MLYDMVALPLDLARAKMRELIVAFVVAALARARLICQWVVLHNEPAFE